MKTATPLLILAALGGCVVGPDHAPPASPLQQGYVRSIDIGEAEGADWWGLFGDPVLESLVAQALERNNDVGQALARLDQSRAAARAAGAALLPLLDGTGGATTVSQSRETAVGKITRALDIPRGYTEYSVGAQASWELDVFGGLRRGREAARADLAGAEASAGAVRVAVAAETADAYLTLRSLQARLAVAQDQERNEELLARLVRLRFEQGVAAEREYNRGAAELERVRALMAPLRAGIEAQMNRIDVLVGRQPGTGRAELGTVAAIPSPPLPSGSRSPDDLLRRRPDVVAAERRLAASDARIGVALAEYYPHVSLSGLFGIASLGTSELVTGSAVQASAGAGLRWRLFDFGRVDAEVAAAKGRRAEALAAWRGSVLSAAEDVETSLARLAEAHRQKSALERQVALLRRARDQARDAYAGGVVDLIEVTDADRELLASSDQLADVRGGEARAAVAAFRALGGGWGLPPRSDPRPG